MVQKMRDAAFCPAPSMGAGAGRASPTVKWATSRQGVSHASVQRGTRATVAMAGAPTPVIEKTNLKESETSKDLDRERKMGPKFHLYIINDDFNRRERVIDILLKTVDGLSFSRAYASMQEAHMHGKGHVVTVVQELAEHYCALICAQGVLSIVEPED